MTALAAATLALYAAAAVAAVVSCSRSPQAGQRPLAVYLAAVLVIDGLRWCQALLLEPPAGPRVGWWLVAWWAEVGLYLASILALPAMAVAVFLAWAWEWIGSSRWLPIAYAWLLLTALIASSYPDLRGPALLRAYDLVELGAVVVALAAVGAWFRSGLLEQAPSPAHLAALALIAGPAGSCCLPWLTRDTALDGWPYVVAGNAVAVAAALVLLLWGLTRARRRRRWA